MLALLVLLVATPEVRASYDPIGGGVTRLVLDKRFAAFLARAGVRVSATAGVAKHGKALVFPVSGGQLDPTIGAGEIEQQGALTLRGPRGRVLIRKLVVKTTHAPLVARVGGSQLKIATSAAIDSRRKGFGTGFSARKLLLTERVATRLNKKLRPRQPFAGGQLIGALSSEAQPLLTAIVPAGRATLVFDSAFTAKLDRLFVALNPIFPAEHVGPQFTLPIIAEGALAPDGSAGILRTGGEIEFLKLGGGQVFWHELWFDLGSDVTLAEVDAEPTPALPGKLGQVPILGHGSGFSVSSEPGARTIGVSGIPVALDPASAALFNQAFAEGDEFHAGEPLGSLSFTATGQ